MSHVSILHSYFSIIQKLQQKPYCTQKELVAHVEKKLDSFREKTGRGVKGLSPSSFGRDIKDIRDLFGVDIQCRKSDNTYYIAGSGSNDRFLQQMADAFHTLQLLHLNTGLQAFVQPEKGGEKDSKYFGIALNAIKNRKQLAFTYLKHWETDTTYRTVSPYLLKEAGRRWYLIAKDHKDGIVKTFALDRMGEDVHETDVSFPLPADVSYQDIYQYTFGIDGPHNEDEEIQEIIFSFDPYQGKYVKALPLHSSQQEVVSNETEYRIFLRLYITRDLVMQILSYGEKVTVLQPALLAAHIATELRTTLSYYRL